MDKRNWLCKIRINGRICFSDYLTGPEVVNIMRGVDILESRTSETNGKQDIVIANNYFEIIMKEI